MITVTDIRNVNDAAYDEVWAIVRSLKNPRKMKHVPELSPSWVLFKKYMQLRDAKQWNADSFEITEGIREVKASRGERFTVKQLEKTKKSLEARLEKLQANDRKDDVVTFEELGVDMMFVDESDLYKNLFLYTKMRNVAGLSTADAQKSSDMFAKCRYLDETTGGRGIAFATGTPISNSMTEMYSIQRYLQYDRLQEMGMPAY